MRNSINQNKQEAEIYFLLFLETALRFTGMSKLYV